MAKKRILTVGYEFPHPDLEYVSLRSRMSLLDGDIIVFVPALSDDFSATENFHGKPCFSESRSFDVGEYIKHWRTQITDAIQAGKTVIVSMVTKYDFYVYTGKQTTSGTGKNQKTTSIVVPRHNYELVPVKFKSIINANGSRINREKNITPIDTFWNEFGSNSSFEVLFEVEDLTPLLRTSDGQRTVGGYLRGPGALILLPDFTFYEDEHFDYGGEEVSYTPDGLAFGARLLAAIVAVDTEAKGSKKETPAPEWAKAADFRLKQESELEQLLLGISTEIESLHSQHRNKLDELDDYRSIKSLLYEKGPPLEKAIRAALSELGYKVSYVNDGESEFDVIFSDEKNRYIGEAEGRDNRPIAIEKLSQLERNIQEDFAKEANAEYATGVIFGNAFRLEPINERKEFFTAKAITAAKRTGTRLIKTPDLFSVVQYLRESNDQEFAAACRKAIADQVGSIVIFPQTTKTEQQKAEIASDDAKPP